MTYRQMFAIGSIFVFVIGCGGGDGNERPTAPVEVTVTYKGKPVDGAIIQFITAQDPYPATGTTDNAGKCSLTTYRQNDGAIIGENLVTITKHEIDKTNIKPVKPEDQDLIGVSPIPTLKSLIPEKYSAPGSSGLKEDVKKGKNTFSFELKDK